MNCIIPIFHMVFITRQSIMKVKSITIFNMSARDGSGHVARALACEHQWDTYKLSALWSFIILFRTLRRSTRPLLFLSMVALGTVSARTLLPCERGISQIFLKAARISSPSILNAISL